MADQVHPPESVRTPFPKPAISLRCKAVDLVQEAESQDGTGKLVELRPAAEIPNQSQGCRKDSRGPQPHYRKSLSVNIQLPLFLSLKVSLAQTSTWYPNSRHQDLVSFWSLFSAVPHQALASWFRCWVLSQWQSFAPLWCKGVSKNHHIKEYESTWKTVYLVPVIF